MYSPAGRLPEVYTPRSPSVQVVSTSLRVSFAPLTSSPASLRTVATIGARFSLRSNSTFAASPGLTVTDLVVSSKRPSPEFRTVTSYLPGSSFAEPVFAKENLPLESTPPKSTYAPFWPFASTETPPEAGFPSMRTVPSMREVARSTSMSSTVFLSAALSAENFCEASA